MSASKWAMQEELSDRRIIDLRQVLQLRRSCSGPRIAAAILNIICDAYLPRGEEKNPR